MDAFLKAFLNDHDALQSRRVEQVVAMCGNGSLADKSPCSETFRNILQNVPSKILKKYADECLDGSQARNQNSGLILQDVVNEVGDRLGYSVEAGFYRGAQSRVGNDGLWTLNDFSFVIEVKTSDLSIKLDRIAEYRQQLITKSAINEKSSSVLIVLGRQDTGDLEAQIRGSKHAWDKDLIILVPFKVFEPWTSKMPTTFGDDGSLTHHHVFIEKSESQYVLRVGEEYKNITEFVLKGI